MVNTLQHLCYILKASPEEIEHLCKNINTYYSQYEQIKEKDGKIKIRIINPSKGRLKILQRRINKDIIVQTLLPLYAYGAIKKRSNIGNAKRHQGKKYIFTTDIKDFFPLINHSMTFKTLRDIGFSPT